jgi:hypothetical protein
MLMDYGKSTLAAIRLWRAGWFSSTMAAVVAASLLQRAFAAATFVAAIFSYPP